MTKIKNIKHNHSLIYFYYRGYKYVYEIEEDFLLSDRPSFINSEQKKEILEKLIQHDKAKDIILKERI